MAPTLRAFPVVFHQNPMSGAREGAETLGARVGGAGSLRFGGTNSGRRTDAVLGAVDSVRSLAIGAGVGGDGATGTAEGEGGATPGGSIGAATGPSAAG